MEDRIRDIVVGFDFSEGGRNALRAARDLARRVGAKLHIVTAIPGPVRDLAKLQVEMPPRLFASLQQQVQLLTDVEKLVRDAVGEQSPVKTLLAAMDARDADLFVVGDIGLAPEVGRAIGYDTERLIRRSVRPVLVINRHTTFPPARILAPVDFSDSGERVLGKAADFARLFGASLHVLHCVEFDPEPVVQLYGTSISLEVMEDWRAHARTQLDELLSRTPLQGIELTSDVALARAFEKIPEVTKAGGFDLVVMGTHGASYAEEILLGGTADRVIRQLPASVCAVKPDSFAYRLTGDVRVAN
jgi:nucleotide-binding universal stress UspA family protein